MIIYQNVNSGYVWMLRLEIIFILIFFCFAFYMLFIFFSNNKYGLLLLFRDNKKAISALGLSQRFH